MLKDMIKNYSSETKGAIIAVVTLFLVVTAVGVGSIPVIALRVLVVIFCVVIAIDSVCNQD